MSFIQQRKIKQKLKILLSVALLLYVMISTSLYFLQEKLLFRPTELSQNHKYEFNHDFEEVFIKAEDGAVINAIHFKVVNPRGVILYFHGNKGNLKRWGRITEYFVEKHYDVFVMDYRSYGKSIGALSETLLYSDAQLCYEYLAALYEESAINVYGRSLGSTFATYVASKNSPNQLFLETPFYSIVDVVKSRLPVIPVKQVLNYEFPSYQFITDVKCPITLFHGTSDGVVPLSSAQKLIDSMSSRSINFVIIPKGSHNNLDRFKAYHQAIDNAL
ncbi:MAG: alpha/beta hydrolase [Flavobacteriaceae bacterium]|nr:alpha/beta hydrolase [Flavobacteriaceae bacterium]